MTMSGFLGSVGMRGLLVIVRPWTGIRASQGAIEPTLPVMAVPQLDPGTAMMAAPVDAAIKTPVRRFRLLFFQIYATHTSFQKSAPAAADSGSADPHRDFCLTCHRLRRPATQLRKRRTRTKYLPSEKPDKPLKKLNPDEKF